jgi:glycosyltransferase involved in cell wall biosynthesis
MSVMTLSLVIPCYNEAGSLPPLIERCTLLAELADVDVVLVDNGSTDSTPDVFNSHLQPGGAVRSLRVPVNRGYGNGILAGLEVATGEYLGWTHADLQADPLDVERGLRLIRSMGSGITTRALVKGRRFGRPMGDTVFTIGMSVFETALLRVPLWDINAQPTLLSRSLYEEWTSPPGDFSLDLFAYHHARSTGASVQRFPVLFGERFAGTSHWNVDWKSKSRFIKRTIKYSAELARNA